MTMTEMSPPSAAEAAVADHARTCAASARAASAGTIAFLDMTIFPLVGVAPASRRSSHGAGSAFAGLAPRLLRSGRAVGRASRLDPAAILNGIEEHREHDDRAGE